MTRPGEHTIRTAATPRTIETIATDLERLLIRIAEAYEALPALTAAHRSALASADADRIGASTEDMRAVAGRLAELDAHRAALARGAAAALRAHGAPAAHEPTARIIAAYCPEPQRSRLLSAAGRAREAGERAQQEQRSLRMAAGALAAHMQGLVAHVARSLSQAGTYARTLAPTVSQAPVACSLDLVS